MKVFKWLFTIAGIFTVSILAAQTVDEILNKYYENIGGKEAWKKITSVKSTAKVSAQGMEFPATMLQKAPNKQKLSIFFQGMEIVQPAFDGTTGWQTNFMTMAAEKMEAEDNEIAKIQSEDFPDAFMKYKERGYTLTLEGSETIEGTDCFKLKMTKKPIKVNGVEQENIIHYFFEKENYVPILIRSVVPKGEAKGMIQDVVYSDYQEVDGLFFPFTIASKFNGQTQATIMMESIEINPEIDDQVFAFPEDK